MVTQLTGYNTQRYTFNSEDDIGDIVFHNGDEILLMDVDLLLIYDEEGNNWNQVPTGGGGGGDSGYFKLVQGTVTPASDVHFIDIPISGLTSILYAFGSTDPDTWADILHDATYDADMAMWKGDKSHDWCVGFTGWGSQEVHYSSGQTSGWNTRSNVVTFTGASNIHVGYSSYNFRAGWTYYWYAVGV